MERQHQRVYYSEHRGHQEFIEFGSALTKREHLIQLKASIENDLYNATERLKKLTGAIEDSCDHKWCNQIDFSCGEKERWSFCEICGKTQRGHAR